MPVRARRGQAVSALLGGVALLAVTAAPVAAECTGGLAPFRDAAPTAERILIGVVTSVAADATTDAVGRSSRFTLRLTDVVRGPSIASFEVRDLEPGCSAERITAAVGEEVALAIDAQGPGRWGTYSTEAWIHAVGDVAPANRITRAQVISMAARAPDTDTARLTPDGSRPMLPIALLAALGGPSGALLWLRRARAAAARTRSRG